MEKISVIVPVLNTAEHLNGIIMGLLKQSYKDLEIIIIDSGSKDETLEICNNWSFLDDRIKIYETKIGNDTNQKPGTITNIYKDGIGVATNDKEVIITKLQIPGKKIMNAKDYLNGVDKKELLNKSFS